MPLTSTERSRIAREKLKADPVKYEAYKIEQSKKKKEYRHSKVLTANQKYNIRVKNKKAQRRCRKKKVEQTKLNLPEGSPGYICKQSLGKAVKKTTDSLPKSPTKKVQVLSTLISKMSPQKRKRLIETSVPDKRQHLSIVKMEDKTIQKSRCDKLSEEEIIKIKEFYGRDDISRMCPGKKDTISIKTSTGREVYQNITIFPKTTVQYVPQASTSTSSSIAKGQWIAVLFDENWWPGEVVDVDEKFLTLKHIFKPITENKFKYLEKPQFEKIPVDSYLCMLPSDPSPDQSARFFSYDLNIASKIKSIVNKLQ